MALDAETMKARAAGVVKKFSAAQLVTIGLLAVVGLLGAAAFVRWASAPTYSVLYTGLAPKEAAAVTAKLDEAGVPYRVEGGGTILVPREQVAKRKNDLAAAGLPKDGRAGYELLDKQGLMTSSFRQQVDYQRALEGELARTIGEMDGIASANVHLVLPQDSVFADAQRKARASVMVTAEGTLREDAVAAVVQLVASSVPELDPAAVTITDTEGRLLSARGAATGADDRHLRLTEAYEDALSAQASSMLDRVLGPGHAIVRVSADLDNDQRTTESETFATSAPVTREQTSTETYQAPGQPAAEGPLTVVPTPGAVATPGAPGGYEKQDVARDFAVGRVVEHRTVTPGQVRRLSVAVVLDESLKNGPDAERVEALVAAAVGLDPKRGDTIVVDSLSFGSAAPAAPAKAAAGDGGGMVKKAGAGLGAVVLLAVMVLLATAIRRPRVDDIPLSTVNAALPGGPSARALAALPQQRQPALTEIVDQRPDEVGALLRSWLAENGSAR